MTDCTNEAMRNLLPELAHDALPAEESARVRSHVAGCGSCAAELGVIQSAARMFAQATPDVDTAAILRALPSAPTGRPVLTLERNARRAFAIPRYALAAAASLVIVATLALPTILGDRTAPSGRDVAVGGSPTATSAPIAILGASALGDLEVDELEALLAELETMEATVSAEPTAVRQPITSAPEGI
jgi:hypothetical protein